eukprot:429969_1
MHIKYLACNSMSKKRNDSFCVMSVVKYHAQITYLAVTVKGYTVEIVQMKGGISVFRCNGCSAYREDLMMAKYESEILHQLHPKGYLYWAESHKEKLKREESESNGL